MSYAIEIPEIKVDVKSIMDFVLTLPENSWTPESGSHGLIHEWQWNHHPEFIRLKSQHFVGIPHYLGVAQFKPKRGQSLHVDRNRTVVVQFPLSENCKFTPTAFYNNNLSFLSEVEWDNTAWMFDSKVWHGSWNTDTEFRYMLTWSFFAPVTFSELSNQFNTGL